MLRTDRGGEFTSNEFTQYCKENGIARQLTAPYSPQQNGVVERRNRTIITPSTTSPTPLQENENIGLAGLYRTQPNEDDNGVSDNNDDDDYAITNGDFPHILKNLTHLNTIIRSNSQTAETLIPMDPGTRLTKIIEGTMVNSTEYRSLIGCLRYLLHTRPDLSYSVSKGIMESPTSRTEENKEYMDTATVGYGVTLQDGKGNYGIIFLLWRIKPSAG
ncbi:ribonuclease H-like domain, reverse transcriptase, RNA-dependent DNA polymerase [Tanacetum coccineum]